MRQGQSKPSSRLSAAVWRRPALSWQATSRLVRVGCVSLPPPARLGRQRRLFVRGCTCSVGVRVCRGRPGSLARRPQAGAARCSSARQDWWGHCGGRLCRGAAAPTQIWRRRGGTDGTLAGCGPAQNMGWRTGIRILSFSLSLSPSSLFLSLLSLSLLPFSGGLGYGFRCRADCAREGEFPRPPPRSLGMGGASSSRCIQVGPHCPGRHAPAARAPPGLSCLAPGPTQSESGPGLPVPPFPTAGKVRRRALGIRDNRRAHRDCQTARRDHLLWGPIRRRVASAARGGVCPRHAGRRAAIAWSLPVGEACTLCAPSPLRLLRRSPRLLKFAGTQPRLIVT